MLVLAAKALPYPCAPVPVFASPLVYNVELTSTTRQTRQPLNFSCQQKLKRAVMGARCGKGAGSGKGASARRAALFSQGPASLPTLSIFCIRKKFFNSCIIFFFTANLEFPQSSHALPCFLLRLIDSSMDRVEKSLVFRDFFLSNSRSQNHER